MSEAMPATSLGHAKEILQRARELADDAIKAQQVSRRNAWGVRMEYRLDAIEGALTYLASQVDRLQAQDAGSESKVSGPSEKKT